MIIFTIDEIKDRIEPIAYKYGVEKVYLFGSYSRQEATQESDVDLLIEKGQIRNLLDYFGFISELEDNLGIHVDVVTTTSNDKVFLENIRREVVLIYEQSGQGYITENRAVL